MRIRESKTFFVLQEAQQLARALRERDEVSFSLVIIVSIVSRMVHYIPIKEDPVVGLFSCL